MPLQEKKYLIKLFEKNNLLFAREVSHMPSIDLEVAYHRLDIGQKLRLVHQRPRGMAVGRTKKENEEMAKLLDVCFIKPVEYRKWIFNIMAAPKKNGEIRVCIYLTNLNKLCPTHPYPLPRISDLVDATTGFGLSFMDTFSGYNH